MKSEESEATIKTLAKTVKRLEASLKILQDIEEIKKLQRTYGFYITHMMGQEIVDLFSNSPDVSLVLIPGKFLGKQGVKRFYLNHKPTPELLFSWMQLSGVVDVDPDGKTAKGRWFGLGFQAEPEKTGGVSAKYGVGIYENEYVKEDGKWKFKKLEFRVIFYVPFGECWVKSERLVRRTEPLEAISNLADLPHLTDEEKYPIRYPSSRILPFHYKHPVTGK